MDGGLPQFRILGPLEVVDGNGLTIEIAGRKPRALLAILLLHANEVVPVSRLIDDLWGEEPPERAAKAVQISVSRLRKALGGSAAVLQTRSGGYAVVVDEGQLDLQRFERLEQDARRAAARGAAEEAAATFAEALALWRGPPLSEFAEEAFGHEIARLAERRLSVTEERVDAELALGRHAPLVAELGHLVEEHPFRERLRAQLMLALARSGRQAEALQVYEEGRRRLVEELGIEPGAPLRELQGAILRQEESVVGRPRPAPAAGEDGDVAEEADRAPVEQARAVPAGRPLRRPRRVGAVAVLILAPAAAVAALSLGGGGGEPVGEHAVAVLDAADAAISDSIDVGERPAAIAVGLGSVWVASRGDATLARIDPETRRVERTFGLGFVPSGLAVGARAVWVTDAEAGSLVRVNPSTGAIEERFDLGRGGKGPISVAVGRGSVWAANSNAFLVVRLDASRNRVVARIPIDAPRFIAVGRESVWVVSATTALVELDPVTNGEASRLPTGFGAGGLALGEGSVWISDPAEDTVQRWDAGTRSFRRTIDVGAGPRSLAFGFGALWVANTIDGSVSRVDPETDEEAATAELGRRPAGLAVGAGAVWATVSPR